MKLAIIGSRDYTNYEQLCDVMRNHYGLYCGERDLWEYRVKEIISGGAKGADSLAARWAKEEGVKLTEHIPEWDRLGKGAGFVRNQTIIDQCDEVLCFWNGESRGTRDSIKKAHAARKDTLIIYV